MGIAVHSKVAWDSPLSPLTSPVVGSLASNTHCTWPQKPFLYWCLICFYVPVNGKLDLIKRLTILGRNSRLYNTYSEIHYQCSPNTLVKFDCLAWLRWWPVRFLHLKLLIVQLENLCDDTFFSVFFFKTRFLYSPVHPETHSVDQGALERRHLPDSASPVLELKARTTTVWFKNILLNFNS